jgi:hypothetical protein
VVVICTIVFLQNILLIKRCNFIKTVSIPAYYLKSYIYLKIKERYLRILNFLFLTNLNSLIGLLFALLGRRRMTIHETARGRRRPPHADKSLTYLARQLKSENKLVIWLELALEMLTKLCTHFKSRLFIALYIEQYCITNQ